MTDTDTSPNGDSIEAPEPIVEKGRGFSLIWVIPIVAVIVGAVVGIDALRNRGVEFVITFPTAEWIEAGKTKIKFLDIEIGTVDSIEVIKTADGVELHCTVNQTAGKFLTEGAKFWAVHPRFGQGGVTGLGTILSGAYLVMELGPGDAKKKRRFAGLDKPPLLSDSSPGLSIKLHAEKLFSLGQGSPVYYRETKVGLVERHALAKDGSGIVLSLFFPKEHADLVRKDSRFWNAGGVQVSGGLTNLEVDVAPLDALLSGGITFDSPRGAKVAAAEADSDFYLHPSRADVETYPLRYGGLRIYVEAPELGSIAIGDQVYYREIPVGTVISQELKADSKHVRVGLNIQSRYATLVRSNSVFWNASGISASLGLGGVEIHTGSIASILAGGIAFATPDSPGHKVKAGSVFQMHDEEKDAWLKWSPMIWRGPPGEAPPEAAEKKDSGGESRIARFFHHKGKDEEASKKAGEPSKDSTQEGAHEEKRHGFFHDLFHKKDKDEKEDKD